MNSRETWTTQKRLTKILVIVGLLLGAMFAGLPVEILELGNVHRRW